MRKRTHRTGKEVSYLEQDFGKLARKYNLPAYRRNYNFHGFEFDVAWPQVRICVEIDGGTFHGGHHVRGKGYQRDCVKNNLAQSEGWVVLRCDREMLYTKSFIMAVKNMILRRLSMAQSKKLFYPK